MIRWILVVAITLVVFSGLRPWLQRIGLGRLPGDLRFRALGRDWDIPLATTIVLSLLASALARWL